MAKNSMNLAKHLGAKLTDSLKCHAKDEVTTGRMDIPGGIKNGVAQLIDCKFGQYKSGPNKGEYYLLAAGTVITPKTIETADGIMKVKGLRTQIMEPVCKTKTQAGKVTSLDEHIASVANELRKLGAEDVDETSDLEAIAKVLKDEAPYFRFSTSESPASGSYPARVWENWYGSEGLEEFSPPEEDAFEEDETDGDEEEETPEEEAEETATEPETEDINELAALADSSKEGHAEAGSKLTELAKEAGCNAEEVDQAPDWSAVIEMIETAREGTTEEPEETFPPEKGQVWYYRAEGETKAVEVEITAVFKNQKVNAKSLDTGKLLKSIPFAELSSE